VLIDRDHDSRCQSWDSLRNAGAEGRSEAEFSAANHHDSPAHGVTADQVRDPNDLRNGERVGGSRSKSVLTGQEPVERKLDDPTRADALRCVDDDDAGASRDAQEIIDIQLADDPQTCIDRQAVAEEGGSRNRSTVVAPVE
jgi:hypothetical protein